MVDRVKTTVGSSELERNMKPGGRRRNAGAPELRSIISADGLRWLDYRRSLTPHYNQVWRDLVCCQLLVLLGVLAPITVQRWLGTGWALTAVVPGAVWIGYWLHALCLFGHEAAHSNIAPSRTANDVLGDWLVWIFFGSTTRHYRRTHMQHHIHLGDHFDTEVSYIRCLSVPNLVEAMTGIYLVEVLLRKRAMEHDRTVPTEAGTLWVSVRSALLHLLIVVLLILAGQGAAAASWVAGTLGTFPLFAMVRTVLEHRRIEAGCDIDFTIEEHGPITRSFGTSLFARTFGAAGFNQHLLHHWDPNVSYTRHADMERFMLNTPLAAQVNASHTTYARTLAAMMGRARRG